MRNAAITAVSIPNNTTVRLAEPSKHRRVLTLSPNLTAGYTASTDPNVGSNGGLVVTAGGGCVTLTFESVGVLVQQAWFGQNSSGGDITVAVLEAFEV
ncbi:MAG: hypothetical protein H6747_14000 [Deltaproteobacteria bacterium]|nr:hypothetical protein [Deltaproteobacteria bacterium]